MSRRATQGPLQMKASETLRAPAKLNLTLEVLSRQPDGFHALRSVMVPLDLCDELSVQPADEFTFTCDVPALACDNLVERALRAAGLADCGVHVALHKRIPTGAGMGGGSSDAAAILLAAQRGLFGSAQVDFMTAARSLGSDVPFFLVETAALIEGTGERVTALGAVPRWHALVIKPPVAVSTAAAYERIDATSRHSRPRSSSVSLQMAQALQRGEFERVVSLLQNDFHDVLVPQTPHIARAVDLLLTAGTSHALLTGSGSCVFALTQTKEQRDALAARILLPEGYALYPCSFWSGHAWRDAA